MIKNLLFLTLLILVVGCGGSDDYVASSDDQSPSQPLNLTAQNITVSSIQLSWDASTDNVGVTGYKVFQNGNNDGSIVNTTTVSITGLSEDSSYSFYVVALDAEGNESQASNTLDVLTAQTPLEFQNELSAMGLYSDMAGLTPSSDAQLYELNSTLFTDYASKQRLIKLPLGRQLQYDNSDLDPIFPDNTLISKTFYYNVDDRDPSLGKQIIETRVLLKISGTWEVANYIWNSAQTEAFLDENGSQVAISYIDIDGASQNINYVVPDRMDCFTCHNNSERAFPIGIKLRSMNFVPSYTSQNQLDYFVANGLIDDIGGSSSISTLPDWTDDVTYDIFERGRAYIDINCAHCHQPGGEVTNFDLDFRYETLFDDSGIYANRGEIEVRVQSLVPTYRMPQIGRSIVHDEGVTMLLEYLSAIED